MNGHILRGRLINIIEALKSGKRFKRPTHSCWLNVNNISGAVVHYDGSPIFSYKEDLFADDWEIEEEKIEITKEQLLQVWNECIAPIKCDCGKKFLWQAIQSPIYYNVLDKLGFK